MRRMLADGALTFLNEVASEGGSPCHLAVDKDSGFVLVTNYSGGTVAYRRGHTAVITPRRALLGIRNHYG